MSVSPSKQPEGVSATQPEGVSAAPPVASDSAPKPAMPQINYPGPLLVSALYIALLLAMFLVALDISIIATAIPTITAQFHSIDQVGWYGSAFFMCLAAFQAFWGKAYKYFPLKIVFLICIGIFEIGSLVVAVAPNSPALIVGRALQGVGGAGITGGCYIICAFITRPQHISTVLGFLGLVWSCSSVLGPILGGVFTQDVTWRWCFYINLPLGGTTMLIIFLLFHTPAHSRLASCKWSEVPMLFDLPGVVILLGAFTCLLLALEDGGVTMAWNSSQPIGLLVGAILLGLVLIAWEWRQGEKAMVVPRVLSQRSILVLSLFTLFAQSAGFARNYNLPTYFQAVQGVSPSESGIRTLPTVLTTSIFSLAGSIAVGRVGYYLPFLWLGAVFITVGSGLIYTLNLQSTAGAYIGYQVLASIGSGLIIQLPTVVAQAISTRADLSVAVAVTLFFQFVGGTIGVSATQNIQNNVLLKSIQSQSNLSPGQVLAAGSSNLSDLFPNPADRMAVVNAYMDGLHAAWIWSIVLSGMAFLVGLAAEWRSIRPDHIKAKAEAEEKKKQTEGSA